MKCFWKLAVVTSAAAVLVACGGGGSDAPATVAANAAPLAINAASGPTAVQAIGTDTMVFAGGVPDFGTTGSTSLKVGAPPYGATTPATFTVTSGASTATGDLTYGSCIFTVKSSNFPASSKLLVGAVIKVDPCVVNLSTLGVPTTTATFPITATLTLNTVTSAPYKVTVSISPSGVVTVNGIIVTIVGVKPVTGA